MGANSKSCRILHKVTALFLNQPNKITNFFQEVFNTPVDNFTNAVKINQMRKSRRISPRFSAKNHDFPDATKGLRGENENVV
jgi:hypothetical protein